MAKFYILKQQKMYKDFNLLEEPSVNEESFFQNWKGFLRQTVNGKTKVALTTFNFSLF
jgi:hypothetical protein